MDVGSDSHITYSSLLRIFQLFLCPSEFPDYSFCVSQLQSDCYCLFRKDYVCVNLLNPDGIICPTYPSYITIPVFQRNSTDSTPDSSQNEELRLDQDTENELTGYLTAYHESLFKISYLSSMARPRKRLPMKVICLSDGSCVCRSGTLSLKKEVAYLKLKRTFGKCAKRQSTNSEEFNIQMNPSTISEEMDRLRRYSLFSHGAQQDSSRPAHNDVYPIPSSSPFLPLPASTTILPTTFPKLHITAPSLNIDQMRQLDADLLSFHGVSAITDFMVETTRLWYCLDVAGSEREGYSSVHNQFSLLSLPFHGSEWFQGPLIDVKSKKFSKFIMSVGIDETAGISSSISSKTNEGSSTPIEMIESSSPDDKSTSTTPFVVNITQSASFPYFDTLFNPASLIFDFTAPGHTATLIIPPEISLLLSVTQENKILDTEPTESTIEESTVHSLPQLVNSEPIPQFMTTPSTSLLLPQPSVRLTMSHLVFPSFCPPNDTTTTMLHLTQAYLLVLLNTLASHSILVHCISGWDRTPFFTSLLRILLWADGECHQSLSPLEISFLVIGYDFLLFTHRLTTRISTGSHVIAHLIATLPHLLSPTWFRFSHRRKIVCTIVGNSRLDDITPPLDGNGEEEETEHSSPSSLHAPFPNEISDKGKRMEYQILPEEGGIGEEVKGDRSEKYKKIMLTLNEEVEREKITMSQERDDHQEIKGSVNQNQISDFEFKNRLIQVHEILKQLYSSTIVAYYQQEMENEKN
ncbi:hypothetical protein BLNAU_7053 [Blattamonas nauphoetae]|uniref:Myotubularin phosphatase domain-containing protein n=1 Tax=Blattamonas nauphoetae TaxID=2049346 RepID=A0ABQ9Y2A2_9EUKA|nr:hypothetical protein BLNAU_7053 [Blattamonas nauphoetae]